MAPVDISPISAGGGRDVSSQRLWTRGLPNCRCRVSMLQVPTVMPSLPQWTTTSVSFFYQIFRHSNEKSIRPSHLLVSEHRAPATGLHQQYQPPPRSGADVRFLPAQAPGWALGCQSEALSQHTTVWSREPPCSCSTNCCRDWQVSRSVSPQSLTRRISPSR